MGDFPIAAVFPQQAAERLDSLAVEFEECSPIAVLANPTFTRSDLDMAHSKSLAVRSKMISVQEELDWQVYQAYGVLNESLCYDGDPPQIQLGERAFEICLAQDCAANTATTTWFDRHGSHPVTTVPEYWPDDYQALVQKRIVNIRSSRELALIERPECKRRWATDEWETLEKTALESWLLTRMEAADLWPRDASPAPKLNSVRQLVDSLSDADDFRRALDLYAGLGSDAHATLIGLIQSSSVPFLKSMRYSESGLRKHTVWQKTWSLQRREDDIDADVVRLMDGAPAELIAQEQKRRKLAEVGSIAVPPKYKPLDFRDGIYWKLRGALDVPKERFVIFPGLERGNDAGSPMLLWAGYDVKARALALTGYLYEMLQREGADAARISPALAGLDELLPWVHQWHPEVDDDLGMSTGDYLQGLFDAQLAQHGLTLTAVRDWQPPAPVRRTRGRRSSTAAEI